MKGKQRRIAAEADAGGDGRAAGALEQDELRPHAEEEHGRPRAVEGDAQPAQRARAARGRPQVHGQRRGRRRGRRGGGRGGGRGAAARGARRGHLDMGCWGGDGELRWRAAMGRCDGALRRRAADGRRGVRAALGWMDGRGGGWIAGQRVLKFGGCFVGWFWQNDKCEFVSFLGEFDDLLSALHYDLLSERFVERAFCK